MNITREPIVYFASNDSAILWWESDAEDTFGHGVTIYEPSAAARDVIATTTTVYSKDGRRNVHKAVLQDLTEDSLVGYRPYGPGFISTKLYSIRTYGPSSSIRIGVLNSPEGFFSALNYGTQIVLDKLEADHLLSCGNILGPVSSISYDSWMDWYDSIYERVSGIGMTIAKATNDVGIYSDLSLPASIDSATYFACSLAGVRIVVLDTSKYGRKSLLNQQRDWAMNQFASSDWKEANNRIILTSDPIKTSLWDLSQSYGDGKGVDKFLAKNLYPLIENSGADLVFTGRCHSYQRGVIPSKYPYLEGNPTHYITCGGMAPAHTIRAWNDTSLFSYVVSSSSYHYVTIDVSTSGLTVTCKNTETGEILDQFDVLSRILS